MLFNRLLFLSCFWDVAVLAGSVPAGTMGLNSPKEANSLVEEFAQCFCLFIFIEKFLRTTVAFYKSQVQIKRLWDFFLLLSTKYFAASFALPFLLT